MPAQKTQMARGVLLVAAAFGVWGATEFARAQDGHRGHGHAQYHDWYKELKNGEGVDCCNAKTAQGDGDCRPVSATSPILSLVPE